MEVYKLLNVKGKFNKSASVGKTDDGHSVIVIVIRQENHADFPNRRLSAIDVSISAQREVS